jgi:membrane associated rhomboid family serine protease
LIFEDLPYKTTNRPYFVCARLEIWRIFTGTFTHQALLELALYVWLFFLKCPRVEKLKGTAAYMIHFGCKKCEFVKKIVPW